MANNARLAIMRAKIDNIVTDLMLKTTADYVYVDDSTTLAAKLATLASTNDITALQQAIDALGALASKDKVAYADLESTLAALIDGKAEASALTEEINRAKAAEEANTAAIGTLRTEFETASTSFTTQLGTIGTTIATMQGGDTDSNKSIRQIANEELVAQLIPGNAAESLNDLQEIAAWIQSHPGDASAMNAAITALQNKVVLGTYVDGEETKEYATVKAYVEACIAALNIGQYAKSADLGALAAKDIITESEVDSGLMEKINASAQGNHSHANKELLDTYTQTEANLADAVAKKHEHANKALLDTYDQTNANLKAAVEAKHTHENAAVLNDITAANLASWNGKAKVYGASETVNLGDREIYIQLV